MPQRMSDARIERLNEDWDDLGRDCEMRPRHDIYSEVLSALTAERESLNRLVEVLRSVLDLIKPDFGTIPEAEAALRAVLADLKGAERHHTLAIDSVDGGVE